MTCYGIQQVAQHVFYKTPVVPLKTLHLFLKPHPTPKSTMKTFFLILAPNGILYISAESAFPRVRIIYIFLCPVREYASYT